MKTEHTLFTFSSSHVAIAAEICVREDFAEARLIPIPPIISAGCGLVLQVKNENAEAVRRALENENISIDGVYDKNGVPK